MLERDPMEAGWGEIIIRLKVGISHRGEHFSTNGATHSVTLYRDRCCCSYDIGWLREDAVERCDIIGGGCKFDGVAVAAVGRCGCC